MKILSMAITALFLFAACNAKKSTKEEQVTKSDSGMTKPVDTSPTSAQKDSSGVEKTEPELGGLGGLTLGLTDAKVVELLGQPASKSKAEEWGADGLTHQDWNYKTQGILLNMDNEAAGKPQAVFSITITSPCTLKTNRNIGIGSTYSEVMTTYEKEIDKTATDKSTITIGSVYGGIIINFKNDKAEKIFVGAAAE